MAQEGHFGESVEMYLKTIAELSVGRELIPVTSIAERLGISTVSASEMVHRLQDRGLLQHTPYKGVRLSREGARKANIVIRSHRMWEIFLVEKLGIDWQRVHEFACRLEHATDREVVEALAAFLDHPTICPHGNPIPSPDGEMSDTDGVPLDTLEAGVSGEILRILPNHEYDILCDYLAARGIKPGESISVVEIAPFDGPISVRLRDEVHALGRNIAQQIVIGNTERIVGVEA